MPDKRIKIMFDAEGTLFANRGKPDEILTDGPTMGKQTKADIYFLGNPSGNEMEERVRQIVDTYELGEAGYEILKSRLNIYVRCDILCGMVLSKLGYEDENKQEEIRSDIEAEVKDIKDPKLFDKLFERHPNSQVFVLSTASPYQKMAYAKVLSRYLPLEKAGQVILANQIQREDGQPGGYKKTDPKCYEQVARMHGPFVFVDDSYDNVAAASKVPECTAAHFDKQNGDLYTTTENAIAESLSSFDSDGM